jgi:multiple sugar transport system permease protein
MRGRNRDAAWQIILLGAIFIATIYLLAPPLWLVISSFTPERFLRSVPPHWIPPEITLDNYKLIFQIGDYDREIVRQQPEFRIFNEAIGNSLILSTCTMVLCVVLGAPAAYSISRFARQSAQKYIMLGLLATRMLPLISVLIPIYIFYLMLGLLNTKTGLILAYTALLLPFVIWILEGFFRRFPAELEEAAIIDGASRFQVFTRIVLPLSVNGIFAAAAFVFVSTWSDFIVALLMSSSIQAFPISVVVAMGIDVVKDPPWGAINAAGLVAGIIPAIIAFVLRGVVVRGLLSGSVKG